MKEMIYDCRDPILPPFRVVSKGAKIGLYVSAAAAGGTVKSMRQFRLLTSRKARCYSLKNLMNYFHAPSRYNLKQIVFKKAA